MKRDLTFREVDKNIFDRIKNNEKSIEIRAGSPQYLEFEVGDELNIICGEENVSKEIIEIIRFSSIEEMLNNLPVSEILPGETTKEEAVEIINNFPGYPERIAEFGLIAWRLK